MPRHNQLIVRAVRELADGASVQDVVNTISKLSNPQTEKDVLDAVLVMEVALATSFREPIHRDVLRSMFQPELRIKAPAPVVGAEVEVVEPRRCRCWM